MALAPKADHFRNGSMLSKKAPVATDLPLGEHFSAQFWLRVVA
jgi:hypothetical protein